MKKVLIRFYSANNLGDDLFIKVITNRYKNVFSLIAQVNTPAFKSIDNLNLYKNRILSSISYRLSIFLNISDLWLSILAKKNDLLVYIGGSLFIEGNNLQKWQQEKNLYQRCKIPYYILGSNVGPYKHEKFINILKDIFKNAEDVCFRDKASYGLYEGLKTTRVASDIAFSLDISKYEIKDEKTAIFSIINCDNRFGKNVTDRYDQEIINMTRQLVNKGYKVIYMSFCKYEGDEVAIKRIVNKLDIDLANKVKIFNYDGNLEEALSLIAKCKIMVASRFHAVILGLLFSKKVLPLAYSNKTINILHDLGFNGDVVDINNINKFDGSNFNFDNLQINNVDEQIKLSESQFQELDKVLVRRKHHKQ